jgi:TonB family protein
VGVLATRSEALPSTLKPTDRHNLKDNFRGNPGGRWHRITVRQSCPMSSVIDISKKWEGRVLEGRFSLRQWLGGSPHSAVFLTNRGLNGSEKAVIKLISAESDAARRGKQDAQLLRWADIAKLSHPHLMRLFESGRGSIDGTNLLYVVMEYAEENLAQVLLQRPLAPEEVEGMLPPTVDALIFLHHAGYVHGHVKPTNIMAVDNQLRISTDNLRKTGEPGERETSPYDAPEIGAAGLSPAADVWSLGATLVAVLTPPGRKDGKAAQAARPDSIPEPFQEIALRCLSADPRRRCNLSDVLGLLKGQEPWHAESVGTTTTTKPKKRWVILPIAATLLLLAALFGRRAMVQRPPTAPGETHPAETQTAPPPENLPPGQSPPPFQGKAEAPQTGTTPGTVLGQVLPEVSRGAQSTIHGRVKVSVQVSVDTSGNVSQATLSSPGPSKYFANQALTAARRWTFQPPQVAGQASPSEWILRFQFGRTSTQVFPAKIRP